MREIGSVASSTARSSATAGICWVLAGVVYLLAEALAASAFPHYSYAGNYISDLGIPDIEMLGNRPIDSPLHMVINIAFVIQGLLFAAAAMVAARSLKLRLRPGIFSLAVIHAVGMVMIAVVHGGQHNIELGLSGVHLLGALFAFLGGHLTAIIMGISLLLRYRARLVGIVSIVVGVTGILGIVMLQIDVQALPEMILPDGTWERIGMYAIVVWEVFVGSVLLSTLGRRSTSARTPVGTLG